MRSVRTATSYLVVAELLGLLGFMLAARYVDGPWRFFPVVLALIAVGGIAWVYARDTSYKEMLYVSVLVSVVVALLIQVLGHTVVPGLAKDTALFSAFNALRTLQLTVALFFAHVVLLALARMARSAIT